MKNSLAKKGLLVFIAVILVGGMAYIYTQNKQTEKPNTETIDCGKKYTSDIVLIGGVDVVKRIAELKLKTLPLEGTQSTDKCDFNLAGNRVAIAQRSGNSQGLYDIVLYDKDDAQQAADPFNQSVNLFTISLNDNILYFEDQFTGGLHDLGAWK